jgi:hypothetical protein
MKRLITLSALFALLGACAVYPRSHTVYIDPAIERGHPAHEHEREHEREHGHARDGDFCPPGQARKGRC